MDFALMSCPYCGRAVDSSDPERYVCQSCGKIVNVCRDDVSSFIRPSEIEDRFREVICAVADDNTKKAMDIAEDLIESTGSSNHDCYFIRGYVYAEMGEDGKALADWRKGLELLSNDVRLDSYICMMSEAIADMILYKEKEFIEFNVLAHVDRLCDDIDTCTGMSCKAFVYYTIYRDCVCMSRTQDDDGDGTDYFKDVIPALFRRVVAYHRNYWCLPRIIDEYLEYSGYNAETYSEDDNDVLHIYDLIRIGLWSRISTMTDEDRIRIFDRWDDKSLKEFIEPMLDTLIGSKKGIKGLLRKKEESEGAEVPESVHAYVDKCLLIEAPAEEPVEEAAPAE